MHAGMQPNKHAHTNAHTHARTHIYYIHIQFSAEIHDVGHIMNNQSETDLRNIIFANVLVMISWL